MTTHSQKRNGGGICEKILGKRIFWGLFQNTQVRPLFKKKKPSSPSPIQFPFFQNLKKAKGATDNSDGLKMSRFTLFLVGLSEAGRSGSGEAGSGAVCIAGADIRRIWAVFICFKKADFLFALASLFSFNFSRKFSLSAALQWGQNWPDIQEGAQGWKL